MPGPGHYLIGKEEEEQLLDVIRAGYLFRYGDEKDPAFKHKVVTLEKEIAEKFGAKYALALTSGTAALCTCFSAAAIGPGDEVIVPGYTFIASIASIIMVGAVPVLAEIDESLTMDPADFEKKITPRTKAVLPVHMLGNSADLDKIQAIADKHNITVIEDSCQAFGASYKGKRLGTIGKLGAYSFNLFKTISAGDGGMVITDDEDLYTRAFGYHDQGHLPSRMGVEVGNRSIIGHNFRMNELTGAVLLAQFRKLDKLVDRLKTVKKRFKDQLQGVEGIGFRKITDEGECNSVLTVLMPSKEIADKVTEKLGSLTVAHSGWHVYNHMEQILEKKTAVKKGPPFYSSEFPTDVEYFKGMLPVTDGILERAINISIGVVDKGLGTPFGVNPLSTDDEIDQKAQEFIAAVKECL